MSIDITTKLEVEVCCQCHMTFAMPAEFQRARKNDHKWFYCPAGHHQYYPGESDEDKLRRERDRLKQQMAQKDDELRAAWKAEQDARDKAKAERARANGYKGHATRITKRAKAGVCPCCNRTFAALAEHMRKQHPDFTPLELEDTRP